MSMKKTDWRLYGDPDMVNWTERGYFAYPDAVEVLADSDRPLRPEAAHYPQWVEALRRAKRGDFSHVPALAAMATSHTHPVNQGLCEELLGDAGPTSTIDAIALKLANDKPDFKVTWAWSSVLGRRGKLADMPVILAAYERVARNPHADVLVHPLCACIETSAFLAAPEHYTTLKCYRAAVIARCQQLADRFGTDQVLIHGGTPLSVTRLAEQALRQIHGQHFSYDLRRRLECMTGIDCSSFYENQVFQPTQAVTLIKEFLESPQSQQFEDGVRYFFGHRISD